MSGIHDIGDVMAYAAEAVRTSKGLVGIKLNHEHIIAWAYATEGVGIRVTADRIREGLWSVDAVMDGRSILHGSIVRGRWMAIKLCTVIRNGIVSKRLKKRRLSANRAARKAAASPAAPASPVLPAKNPTAKEVA